MKSKRKPISKKLRFEIFKRDNFTCQYCSSKPPKAPLEVDHIIPVKSGGTNDVENLITACFDCNRGKGARELLMMPLSTIEKADRMKIAQEQFNQYKRILNREKKIINGQIDSICNIYSSCFEDWSLTERFRLQIKQFISQIGFEQVEEAMEISCSKITDPRDATKYFCGIVWNKIRNHE
jgi:hypothetical protein